MDNENKKHPLADLRNIKMKRVSFRMRNEEESEK